MAASDDPAYQAYLRALGFNEDLARQDAARQRTQISGGAQLVKPELMAQGEVARENISDSFEDRGLWKSSERLRGLAGQRRGEQYQLAMIDKSAADSLADVEMGLARELAGISQQRIQAEQANTAYNTALAQQQQAAAPAPLQIVMLGHQTQQPVSGIGYRPRLSPEARLREW